MSSSRCRWVERDPTGRPRCEHGWAHSTGGGRWRCPLKAILSNRRYYQTDKGREAIRRHNQTDSQKSSKQLYELTRIRVR